MNDMKNKRQSQNSRLKSYTLIADELSIAAAFVIAVTIRFKAIVNWVDFYYGIYASMFITVMLFQIIIFNLYDNKRPSIVLTDSIEIFFRLVKGRAMLVALTVMYFFVTHRAVLASRIVLVLFFSLSIAFGYLFKILLRRYYIRNWSIPGDIKAYVFDVITGDINAAINAVADGGYDCVLILSENAADTENRTKEVIKKLELEGIRTYESVESLGYKVRPGIISDIGGYATIPSFVRSKRYDVFGVGFCIARVEEAVRHVISHVDELKGKYICFSNVHTTVMARESTEYRDILNGAAFVFPDGAPIARLERLNGYYGVERVAGPDFMDNMFRDTQDGTLSHFFYGSTQETIDKLRVNLLEKYPGIDIRGMYSPPFRPLTPEEDLADVKMINDSGADIIWIGLGAPKQEKWMNAHKGKINGVMMGVGAGFDFHGGTLKRAPGLVQRAGFEWLYRLINDPVRLFSRYFVTNIKFFWYLLASMGKHKDNN